MNKVNFGDYDKIVIYGNGKKLLEKTRDFFKISTFKNGIVKSEYNNITSINLFGDIKQARKENLNRTDNYELKYIEKYYSGKKSALYIHDSEIMIDNLGEYIAMNHNGERDYLYAYRLTFNHGAIAKIRHLEKMCVEPNWTIPEDEKNNGAHWKTQLGDYNNSYDIISEDAIQYHKSKYPDEPKYNLLHWYETTETITENVVTSEEFHKIEKDEQRKERENIAEKINKVLGSSSHISHYDIERLLEVFNITVKPGKEI